MTARLIDRPIRPMFAEGFRNGVQVINTVLSYDENASAPMAAIFGSSGSSISDIPFNGPIVARRRRRFHHQPKYKQIRKFHF